MPKRVTEDGPTTAARAGRFDAQEAAQETEEAAARANAMREQATAQASGSAAIRPKQRDPKQHLEAQAAARAASTAQAALFAGQFASLTEGAMGDGAFDADEEADVELEEEKEEAVQDRRQMPTGQRGPEFGGEADPETTTDPPDPDGTPSPGGRGPAKWPRVSPSRRVRQLDLDRLLALGEAEGLLVGWQGRTVLPRVLGLNSQWFHGLAELLAAAERDLAKLVLLKALAAHRHPSDIAALGPVLAPLDDDAIRAWRDGLEAERSAEEREQAGPAPEIEVLRRHYDPLASLLTEPAGPGRPEEVEEWAMPMWVRGTRREALELCAVAFAQAACDQLHPEWETSDGASDPLMAALEVHHDAHPAIARWCTTLGARAQDLAGLWSAIDVLRQARSSV